MQTNPYQPPSANINEPAAVSHNDNVPASVIEAMQKTKPWVRFLGILGFIGCGFLGLLGIGILVAGGMGNLPAWVGFVYLPFGLLYLAPSLYLYRYGRAIEDFLRAASIENLGAALAQQKSFWRYVGILMASILILYAVALGFGAVAGFITAVTRR